MSRIELPDASGHDIIIKRNPSLLFGLCVLKILFYFFQTINSKLDLLRISIHLLLFVFMIQFLL
jgi:hypothetical protein